MVSCLVGTHPVAEEARKEVVEMVMEDLVQVESLVTVVVMMEAERVGEAVAQAAVGVPMVVVGMAARVDLDKRCEAPSSTHQDTSPPSTTGQLPLTQSQPVPMGAARPQNSSYQSRSLSCSSGADRCPRSKRQSARSGTCTCPANPTMTSYGRHLLSSRWHDASSRPEQKR